MLKCFSAAAREDSLEDEVFYLRRLLDRESRDRKEAQELLSQEKAKCALLEQEISSAAQAAREMGESLKMYFSQAGSDVSSDDRLRAMREAAFQERTPALDYTAEDAMQQDTLPLTDRSLQSAAGSLKSQQLLEDAYHSYDQSFSSVAGPFNKHSAATANSRSLHLHHSQPQHRQSVRVSCSSSIRAPHPSSSADFSPLLSSQSRLGAGSKRMQYHILQVADQLQDLAMGWKQRLDECQPMYPAVAGSAVATANNLAPASLETRVSAAYNPAAAEEKAAAANRTHGPASRLRPPAAAAGAKQTTLYGKTAAGTTCRDSFTFSECSSSAAPLIKAAATPLAETAAAVRVSHEDSFPTPPMSASRSQSLLHRASAGHDSGTAGFARVSGTSGDSEGWGSSRSTTGCPAEHQSSSTSTAGLSANDVSSSTGSWQGIGRYKSSLSWQKHAVGAVAEEEEQGEDQLQQKYGSEVADRVLTASPVDGSVSVGSLPGIDAEESELSEPEQFPDAAYGASQQQASQPTHQGSPLCAWQQTTCSNPAGHVVGCAITRGSAALTASPSAADSSPGPALVPAAAARGSISSAASLGPSAAAVASAPRHLQQWDQHFDQMQEVRMSGIDDVPKELRPMAPLTRHQHYLGTSLMNFAA